jgi:Dihydrofolate reductase
MFGGRTYEAFARDWPRMDDPADKVATRLNRGRKYAASRSPLEASWENSVVVPDALAKVAELRAEGRGELQIHGSTTLARALFAEGLIDELRLATAPVVIGPGRRLFSGDLPAIGLKRLSSETTPAGLALDRYAVTGPAAFGSYAPEIAG